LLILKNKNHFNNFFIESVNPITTLSSFLLHSGSFSRYRCMLGFVFKQLNFFIFSKKFFILQKYENIRWLLHNFYEKNKTCITLFDSIIELIKPPFVVKSIVLPKKIKKKTKQKYAIKLVYKNEQKRIRSSYKQIQYHTTNNKDSTLNVRLYKTLLYTLLE